MNAQLKRNSSVTGRWCPQKRQNSAGDRLEHFLSAVGLKAANTYFQKNKKKLASYLPMFVPNNVAVAHAENPRRTFYRTIDFISCSDMRVIKDASSTWTPSIMRFGRMFDHAAVFAKCTISGPAQKYPPTKKTLPTPDWSQLKYKTLEINNALSSIPLPKENEDVSAYYDLLTKQMIPKTALRILGPIPKKSHRLSLEIMSPATLELLRKRRNAPDGIQYQKELSKAISLDWENHWKEKAKDINEAFEEKRMGRFYKLLREVRRGTSKYKARCPIPMDTWKKDMEEKFRSQHPELEWDHPPIPNKCAKRTPEDHEDFCKILHKILLKPSKSALGQDNTPGTLWALDHPFKIVKRILFNAPPNGLPKSWQSSHLVPIYKGRKAGPTTSTGAYRMIAIKNHLAKSICKTVLNRNFSYFRLEATPHQIGGFPGSSTLSNIQKVRQHMQEDNIKLFTDFEKAFPSVKLGDILETMDGNICAPDQFLIDFSLRGSGSVRVGPKLSPQFDFSRGIREGCPLSTYLFGMVLGPVLKKIQTKLSLINVLFYVDDGCFVSKNFEDLEMLIDVVEEEFAQIGLKLNKKKCGIIGPTPPPHQTKTKNATELANEGQVECSSCSRKFLTARSLGTHTRWCRGSPELEQANPRSRIAQKIWYLAKKPTTLKKTWQQVASKFEFKCNTCSTKYETRKGLRTHKCGKPPAHFYAGNLGLTIKGINRIDGKRIKEVPVCHEMKYLGVIVGEQANIPTIKFRAQCASATIAGTRKFSRPVNTKINLAIVLPSFVYGLKEMICRYEDEEKTRVAIRSQARKLASKVLKCQWWNGKPYKQTAQPEDPRTIRAATENLQQILKFEIEVLKRVMIREN